MRTSIFILACFVLASCDDGELKPSSVSEVISREEAAQTSYGLRMTFSDNGDTRAVLSAARARIFDAKHYTLLDSGMKVDFFDRDGDHSSLLVARWARIDDISKNMTAFDSVRVISDAGTLVETDSLHWHNQKRLISSDAYVRITEKSGRITTGHGFESDQDLVKYRILRPTIVTPQRELERMNAAPSFGSTNTSVPSVIPPPVEPSTIKKDS